MFFPITDNQSMTPLFAFSPNFNSRLLPLLALLYLKTSHTSTFKSNIYALLLLCGHFCLFYFLCNFSLQEEKTQGPVGPYGQAKSNTKMKRQVSEQYLIRKNKIKCIINLIIVHCLELHSIL